ncbi:sugar phosphate isomerase/epimerase [uncultured Kriegella sp.]|mgnify:CR=1 FL=1|uniref:sugar phosphate isomerase/epimerase family protein n=1 Tax=uncultured Kriegella sp. TaxID=1798910 RepID=UPI0030DBA62D|tara:strand:+ start:28205 stop:29149 length:945 start_codon:yes stop_codon:yes gene_type:complete
MNRRKFIAGTTAASFATVTFANSTIKKDLKKEKRYQNGQSPWPICLDTATIRTAKSLEEKVDIAIAAGYDAIEPWDNELEEYEKNGGDLKELGKKIRRAGLFVPSMIGLWGCLPENEEAFQASLPATKNRMRMAADIGCTHIQAIPNKVGEDYDVKFVASCYRRLLEIGLKEYNIIPALVFVKMFPLKTMGQAVAVALDADHPMAKIIPDVYHMYISEGGFEGLKLLNGNLFAIFQFNDAPKGIQLQDMKDKHRVYPGDGMLPLAEILKDLKASGFDGCISLELYNPEYHKQDLLQVAKTGLRKTLEVITEAGV